MTKTSTKQKEQEGSGSEPKIQCFLDDLTNSLRLTGVVLTPNQT